MSRPARPPESLWREDILGLTAGGADGLGHLGFAAAPGLVPFGPDVFNRHD
jgi:hypothetical protein